jgi:hypothetical protein
VLKALNVSETDLDLSRQTNVTSLQCRRDCSHVAEIAAMPHYLSHRIAAMLHLLRLREQEQLCSDQVQINHRALLNQLEMINLNEVMQVRINDLEMVCSNKDAMVTKSDAMATKALKKVITSRDKITELEETVKTLEETVKTLEAKLESASSDLTVTHNLRPVSPVPECCSFGCFGCVDENQRLKTLNSTLLSKLYPIELYHQCMVGKHLDRTIDEEAIKIKKNLLMFTNSASKFFDIITRKYLDNIFNYRCGVVESYELLSLDVAKKYPGWSPDFV